MIDKIPQGIENRLSLIQLDGLQLMGPSSQDHTGPRVDKLPGAFRHKIRHILHAVSFHFMGVEHHHHIIRQLSGICNFPFNPFQVLFIGLSLFALLLPLLKLQLLQLKGAVLGLELITGLISPLIFYIQVRNIGNLLQLLHMAAVNIKDFLVPQEIHPWPARKVWSLNPRPGRIIKGGSNRQKCHPPGRKVRNHRLRRPGQVLSRSRKMQSPPFQRFKRPEQSSVRIIQHMVVGNAVKVKPQTFQVIQHILRRRQPGSAGKSRRKAVSLCKGRFQVRNPGLPLSNKILYRLISPVIFRKIPHNQRIPAGSELHPSLHTFPPL